MDKEEIKKEAKQLEREGLSIKRQIEILEIIKNGKFKMPILRNEGWKIEGEKEVN